MSSETNAGSRNRTRSSTSTGSSTGGRDSGGGRGAAGVVVATPRSSSIARRRAFTAASLAGSCLVLGVLAVTEAAPVTAPVTTAVVADRVGAGGGDAAPRVARDVTGTGRPSFLDTLFPGGGTVPWDVASAVEPGDAGYVLPVTGALRAPFRAPPQPWASGHRGIDLAAPLGAEVISPAPGTVVFAGVVVDRPVVTVLHADGRRSSLEPVDASVAVGASVGSGAPLGTVAAGTNHCAPTTCVHWGVRENDAYVDPLGLLPRSGPVVLLPVPPG